MSKLDHGEEFTASVSITPQAFNQVAGLNIIIDKNTKNLISLKFYELKGQALSQIFKIEKTIEKSIEKLIKEALESIEKLFAYIKTCEDIIETIEKINEIERKKYFTPLEKLLLSKNIDNRLDKIGTSTLTISEIPKMFNLDFHFFPHSLFNYSNHTLAVKQEYNCYVYPSKQLISHKSLLFGSKFLLVGENDMLITGGIIAIGSEDDNRKKIIANNTYQLDLKNMKLYERGNLKDKRI